VGSLLDIVQRRFTISLKGLLDVPVAITCAIGVVAFVIAIRRRERVFAPLHDQPAFMAAIWGAFSATVIGALANDSGPVMLALGFLGLLFATGYVQGRPRDAEPSAPAPAARPRRRPRVRAPAR
jgi:4-amino-4-deoxy-L-arabinose transferase-like glycosyltransferase